MLVSFRVVGLLVCPDFPLLFPGRAFLAGGRVAQAATCRVLLLKVLFHSVFHGLACGQCWGRCSVRWRCGLAIRAGILISRRRRVAPRATA